MYEIYLKSNNKIIKLSWMIGILRAHDFINGRVFCRPFERRLTNKITSYHKLKHHEKTNAPAISSHQRYELNEKDS